MRRTVSPAACVCLALCLLAPLTRTGGTQQPSPRARLRHTIAESLASVWSPDSKTLAVSVEGKGLLLYDATDGRPRAEIKHEGPPARTPGISFTPDGRALILHRDRVALYDATDGRLLREFAQGTEPINLYRKFYTPVENENFDPDNSMRSTTVDYPSDEKELEELPTRYLSDRVVSPDGKSLLVRAPEGRAQVFDLATGELKFTLGPVPDAVRKRDEKGFGDALGEFSPDGRLILTTHRNGTPRLWNAATGAHVADLTPQPGMVVGARFSHDGRFVATTTFTDHGVVKIWEAATGRLRHTIGSPKDRHYFAVWNPRNNTFVMKTRRWEVKVWDAEAGALVSQLDGKAVKEKFDKNLTFVYSPDGKVLLTQARHTPSFWYNLGVKTGKPRLIAHLWDAETGALLASLRDTKLHSPHAYEADKFFWSPAGDYLITAGASVKFWDRRGALVQELDGDALAHAGLSADGKFLALTGIGTEEINATIPSTVVIAAKILVGKLPKFPARRTHVWQLDVN